MTPIEDWTERILKTCQDLGITPAEYARRYNELTPDQIKAMMKPKDTLQRLDAWLKGGTGRKVSEIRMLDDLVLCGISEDRYGPPYVAQNKEGFGDTPEAAVSDALDKIGAPQ